MALPEKMAVTRVDNAWKRARKFLCVRLDSLGDVLMSTPAIRALKSSRPGSTITLLTSPAGAKVAAYIPEVDDVIVYEAPWMKATASRSDSAYDYQIASTLRKARFDAAVIFTVFSQNPLPAAYLAFLANIPLRLAYCRENPYQLLTHWMPETDQSIDEPMRHEVRRQLDLVAGLGFKTNNEALSLQVSAAVRRRLSCTLKKMRLDMACPWVIVHPGASAASRRYRPDGFAAVARSLALEHKLQVVFTGSGDEANLVEEIQEMMGDVPSISLVDRLDLGELAALLALASLLISNNSGPVHMAAAVGTPVVDIYALTNPQHTPWGVPHRLLYHDVPCKFCYKSVCPMHHHNCLRKVAPEAVVQAAVELLYETRQSQPEAEIKN